MALKIRSDAFPHNQIIPSRYTGDGNDLSPPLHWSDVPDKTGGFALLCDDPDAPSKQPWVHWVMYDIPPGTRLLPEGIPNSEVLSRPVSVLQGRNSWGTVGYRGPAPPRGHGPHHYHFRLFALDQKLQVPSGIDEPQLLVAIKGHILAEAILIGTYQR